MSPTADRERLLAQLLAGRDADPAVALEGGRRIDYGELRDAVWDAATNMPDDAVVFLFGRWSSDIVLAFYGAIVAGAAIGLFDDRAPSQHVAELIDEYDPELVVLAPESTLTPAVPRPGLSGRAPGSC